MHTDWSFTDPYTYNIRIKSAFGAILKDFGRYASLVGERLVSLPNIVIQIFLP